MGRKSREKRERREKGIARDISKKEWVLCPSCGALSYPYILQRRPDMTLEEQKALFCASCKINLTPIFQEFEELKKKAKKKIDKELAPV